MQHLRNHASFLIKVTIRSYVALSLTDIRYVLQMYGAESK